MKVISIRQARLLDKEAKEVLGIPEMILMENAGLKVAEEIIKLKKKKIALVCGLGNNGGDGFVCTRHLLTYGFKPDIFLVGKISEIKTDSALKNLKILLKLKQKIYFITAKKINFFRRKINKYNLIVDALLGIGLKGKVEGLLGEVIKAINKTSAYIVSIDIPSGLDADKGIPLGICIKANKTVTFQAIKRGFLNPLAGKFLGKVVVKNLGFPLM